MANGKKINTDGLTMKVLVAIMSLVLAAFIVTEYIQNQADRSNEAMRLGIRKNEELSENNEKAIIKMDGRLENIEDDVDEILVEVKK